ncbi:UGSC family (seleno)protein [Pseudonocardia oroxyli]|uniref:UGSC-like domain-containing protein n=1 Tax=Pseudonocardia oroxyli TaxID=366584 RepID=A0A1G7TI98_PSEOR|nr:hypothetical protein [Pseudonocardia oroxyli]SDG34379.1 hypothetical protein SAMN05216377_11125 [Pseudonocardia oroxyli]
MSRALDSAILQRAGVSAFVVTTEPFRAAVDRIFALQKSDVPLPFVVLDHPVQNIPPELVEQRAVQLADWAERLLNGDVGPEAP